MTAQQEQLTVKHSDFSIDHILNRAGNNSAKGVVRENVETFQWLQCSRYCPPRIPRMHKKDVQKRQLGRHPRIPFTSYQLLILEQKFKESPYLSSEEVTVLSRKLQLADIRVKIWFQNRRARERRERNGGVFRDKTKLEDPTLLVSSKSSLAGAEVQKSESETIVSLPVVLDFSAIDAGCNSSSSACFSSEVPFFVQNFVNNINKEAES